MRAYPSVPNVFRVASTQSINNEPTFKPPGDSGAAAVAISTNSNANAIRSGQQQHQQQASGIISGRQQQLMHQHSLTPTKALHTITTTAETHDNYLQRHQPTLGASNNIAMQNQQQPHKLTTTASIEHNFYKTQNNPTATAPQLSFANAPMPRSTSALPVGNGDLRPKQQKQLQQHNAQQLQQSSNKSGARHMVGVINTISGSIPSTGFANGPASSFGSDFNVILNNSCTDLKELSELQKQQTECRNSRSQASIRNYPQRPNHSNSRFERNKDGYLWILTPVAASISVAIVIAALAGPQWLFTEEKLPNTNYNGTANFNALDDGAFITKYTKSSLWILCTTLQGVETYNCIKIDYFPQEGYQPDPHDSTPAIPYTVTKSCPFFLASGIFLLISFIVFLIPTCSHRNSLYYFSAGIMFIVSGLLMLIGLIAYISILKAEIGSKLRPRSTLQPALFKVSYGQSFFLFVLGFIATEFVGVLNIFLYISLQEVSYYSRLPCFTISNFQEKIKEGQNPLSQSCRSYINTKPNLHQVYTTHQLTNSDVELHTKRNTQQTAAYSCQKHPNNKYGSNFYMNNELENRFYFEKPLENKCNLHAKNLAKSLNELYTEPAPASAPPPPPSALRMGGIQTLPRPPQEFADIPQEYPLTRSVSTTTDIYANGLEVKLMDGYNNGNQTGKSNGNHKSGSTNQTPDMERRNRRNMATNTRSSNPEAHERLSSKNDGRRCQTNDSKDVHETEPQFCGLKRGIRKTKDDLFYEFCKRAGVRPKPKNIYYIANEEEQAKRRQDEVSVGDSNDDDGFQQLPDDEEHIYVIEDNPQLPPNAYRTNRRSSMFVEPSHLRKLNSNLSLHTLYPTEKLQPENALFDIERYDLQRAYNGSLYGGSQNRLHYDSNAQLYQSRTLPRTFLKRTSDSQDSIGSASMHASASALHNAYSASQNRLTGLLMQHQQQQSRFHSQAQYQPVIGLHKSCENIALNLQPSSNTAYATIAPRSQYLTTSIATPKNLNHYNSNSLQTNVQWPAAIPSSPSNFPVSFQLYPAASNQQPHPILARTTSGGPPKFQRAYAFDEPRRASAAIDEAFDLDQIELERRRSHGNLLGVATSHGGVMGAPEHYDMINGTAV